jgi:hypothetical protein
LGCCAPGLLAGELVQQVGTIMSEFPLDPQLAKMLVASPEFRCYIRRAGRARLGWAGTGAVSPPDGM